MPFSNPILAGDTLIRDAIQSEGYTPGVTGWSIQRDGNAEFNDADIRGTLDVVGSDPDARIRIVVNGGTPVMEVTDSAGNIYEFKAANTTSMSIRPTTSPNAGLHFVRGEGIALRSDLTGAPSVLFDDDSGFLKHGSFSPWTEHGWTALANGGAWAGTVEYIILPHGEIMYRGSLSGGANVVGNPLLAVLPADIRPVHAHRFQMAMGTAVAGEGRAQFDTAGNVVIAAVGGSASYWFDQVRYLLY